MMPSPPAFRTASDAELNPGSVGNEKHSTIFPFANVEFRFPGAHTLLHQ